MFNSGGNGMWPGGKADNPTWPPGDGFNSGQGGWSNPSQGGQSHPASGPWMPCPSGGGSNPGTGGWAGGGGCNPAPGAWSGPSGGGSYPGPGGWAGGGGIQPTPGSWPPTPSGGPSAPSAPASQKPLRVPYTNKLLNGVYDKLLITITGIIKSNPTKFTVNMSSGRDIAFHFNPRFNENGRQVIVMNTFKGGRWGKEERETRFPFVSGQQFEMKILCTSSEYKVAINGSHLVSFRHRITDLRSITTIDIYHDVDLTNFKMETLP